MKPLLFVVALSAVALSGRCLAQNTSAASARPFRQMPHLDPFMLEPIAPPPAAPINDYIIALSKAAGLNIIADATEFAKDAQVKQFPASEVAIRGLQGPYRDEWRPVRLVFIGDLTHYAQLSRFRFDEKTFLLWSEPKLLELAGMIVQRRQSDIAQSQVQEFKADRALRKYLQEAMGWDEKAMQTAGRVRIADLPPEVRELVEVEMRRRIFASFAKPGTLEWFTPDYWKQVRLGLFEHREGEKGALKVPGLQMLGPVRDGAASYEQALPIGRVDALMRQRAARQVTPPLLRNIAAVDDASSARAQQEAPAPAQAQKPPVILTKSDLVEDALEQDAALAAKVSFEAKRMPLKELLALLHKESGVTLSAGEDVLKRNKSITARAQQMTLASVMSALSRMYGVTWTKAETGYTMSLSDADELRLKMLAVGELYYYRLRERFFITYQDRIDRDAALAGEVFDSVDFDELRSPQGVLFTSLPEELQSRVIEFARTKQAERVVVGQVLLEEAADRELYLRLGTLQPNYKMLSVGGTDTGTISQDRAGLIVETDTGAFVTQILPSIAAVARLAPEAPAPPGQAGE